MTIYHGDCREILPQIGRFDLLLTDPPYGVSGEHNSKTAGSPQKNAYGTFKDSPEYVRERVIPAINVALGICKAGIVTPGNRCLTFYPAPNSFGSFFQPASVGLQPWGRADSQPIFYYGSFPWDSKRIPENKCSFRLTESPEKNGHPCPKPIGAWLTLASIGAKAGESILDPFAGSGTTGRVAKDIGAKATLIEIEEIYCEIAAKRMWEGSLF